MPQWGNKQKEELARLFEKGLFVKACSVKHFRSNDQNFASLYLGGQAIKGKQRGDLDIEPEDTKLKPEDIEPEDIVFADGESAFKEIMMAKSTMYKGEIELKLPVCSHTYHSSNYMCEHLIIVPPASFDGAEGSYQIKFDTKNTEFFLKFKQNPVLDEPHHIHAYQTAEHGRVFADDLLAVQTFKKSAAFGVGKWYTFRHKCSWQSKFSEDLGCINPLTRCKGTSVPPFENVDLVIGHEIPTALKGMAHQLLAEDKMTDKDP
eukprot:jgi/Psemu1/2026/gm1.2026_g